MKTKLFIALLMFPIALSAQMEYKGLGIFKAYQGDVITILPDTAFIINKQIFEAGLRAFEYVDSNQLQTQIESLKNQLEVERKDYNNLKSDYDTCMLKRQLLVDDLELKIDILIGLNKELTTENNEVDAAVQEKDKIIERLNKRVRWRTTFGITAFTVWLVEKGIDLIRD